MRRICFTLLLLLGITLIITPFMCHEILAAPSVKLTINPNETDISTGSDPIALTARASGSGLTFEWKVLGPGRLDGPTTDTAIFYVPPASVDGGKGRAIVSVRITDKQGEDTTESVIFNIKGSAAPKTSSGSDKESSTAQASAQQADEKGFSFALQHCKRSGSKLTCQLLITNRDQDKNLTIYRNNSTKGRRTRLIDEFGNEYIATFVQLGSNSTENQSVNNLLVVEVPTKTLLSFEDVNVEATTIALLELSCRDEDTFRAQLRNVPISQ